MYHSFLFTLFTFFLSVAFSADQFDESFGVLDPNEAGRDFDLVELTSLKVASIDDDSPAQEMGLRIGDVIVGLDGLRIIGPGEWDIVRFCRKEPPPIITIAVLRDYRVIELSAKSFLPGRRVGYMPHMNWKKLSAALNKIGFKLPNAEGAIGLLSPRAALALLRWHAYRKPTADISWIPKLSARLTAMVAGRWTEIASLPEPQVPDDCPEIKRLVQFYEKIALHNEKGEQPPDANRHGESLVYYVMNYPYPRVILPPLGAVTHPDKQFIVALEKMRVSTIVNDIPVNVFEEHPAQIGESNYALCVRWSMLDDVEHGAWPYRHQEVREVKSRPAVINELQSHITANDPLADLSRYALASALLIDALESGRKDPVGEVLPLMSEVKKKSPLWGYLLATEVVMPACNDWQVLNIRDQIRDFLDDGALPDSEPPSQLLNYLRRHDTSLSFRWMNGKKSIFTDQLHNVYRALANPTAFNELQQQILSPDISQQPPARRQELMTQLLNYVRFSCQKTDIELMAQLELPGAFTKALSEIAYWHALTSKDQSWLLSDKNMALFPEYQPALVERVNLAVIPWDDRDATIHTIGALQLIAGTPIAMMLLADKCSAHGRDDLANPLRDQVQSLYNSINQLFSAFEDQIDPSAKQSILRAQILTYSGFPQTAEIAREFQDEYALSFEFGQGLESTPLYFALSTLNIAPLDLNMAVAQLCESFDMNLKKDLKPLFLTAEISFNNCPAFRTWLLARLVKENEFPNHRLRIIASSRADMVDDAFAALLGVSRESLLGSGEIAPDNN